MPRANMPVAIVDTHSYTGVSISHGPSLSSRAFPQSVHHILRGARAARGVSRRGAARAPTAPPWRPGRLRAAGPAGDGLRLPSGPLRRPPRARHLGNAAEAGEKKDVTCPCFERRKTRQTHVTDMDFSCSGWWIPVVGSNEEKHPPQPCYSGNMSCRCWQARWTRSRSHRLPMMR